MGSNTEQRLHDVVAESETRLGVVFAGSNNQDSAAAVAEIREQFGMEEPEHLIFFCSPSYDLGILATEFCKRFTCHVNGCTTSGEISAFSGYGRESLIAVGLNSDSFLCKSYLLGDLTKISLLEGRKLSNRITEDFPAQDGVSNNRFGFLLIDGMSFCEENTIGILAASLSPLPIIGGSAGDNLRFEATHVYHEGKFLSGAAKLLVVETSHPFKLFQIQHFNALDTKLVITEADPKLRKVSEINGYPAAEEYANLIGVTPEALSSDVFSLYPLMLKIGGEYHVRSIQKVNDDGSLSFYCAIDNGLVMTIGTGEDIIEQTSNSLAEICGELETPKLTLGCDCILRRLELEAKNSSSQMADVLSKYNFFGFSTYGEQYKGVHVNQTLTGVMIGG